MANEIAHVNVFEDERHLTQLVQLSIESLPLLHGITVEGRTWSRGYQDRNRLPCVHENFNFLRCARFSFYRLRRMRSGRIRSEASSSLPSRRTLFDGGEEIAVDDLFKTKKQGKC